MTLHRTSMIATLLFILSTPAFAQPGAATLIAPSSDVVGSTIAFSWHSAPTATWYHFWLGKPDTTLIMEHWYTADHARCAAGGTCSISVTPPLVAGPYIWHLRTWSSAGYGPWSPAHMFTLRDVVQAWTGMLPPSRRFTLVLNSGGVLDNETGLVWQRAPHPSAFPFHVAQSICGISISANRYGWRVPTLSELMSLLDAAIVPHLPPGHPFNASAPLTFWTATESAQIANQYFVVDVDSGGFTPFPNNFETTRRVWCVRGGATSHR
jgi:hypothetical protein